MEATGGSALIADSILSMTQSLSPAWVLLVVLVATMFISDIINNNATAVLMAPIALTVANRLGANPDAFLIAVALGALLQAAGFAAGIDPARGLDHGAWAPLLYVFPRADVPVVQLSLQVERGPRHHLELGRALAPLAAEGVLIVGSGHLTHNLGEMRSLRDTGIGPAAPYVAEFQEWVRALIEAHDYDTLTDYRRRSPAGVRAHPTEEHFLPLFVALGAAGGAARAERLIDHVESGVMAMDAYLLAPG
jgi:4,5-DOPA dioxygenase extradiol